MITKSHTLAKNRVIHQFRGNVSNIYIIEDHNQDSTFLIDCGMPSDTQVLLKVLDPLPPLKRIVCTHFHVDHVSGWISLKKSKSDCEILLHEAAKPFVMGHRRIPMPSFNDYISILIPCMRDYGYIPGWRDILKSKLYGTPFKKGFSLERVRFFTNQQTVLPEIQTISTPGHRPDSVSFFDPDSGILVTGDFIVVIGDRLISNAYLSSPKDQQSSISKILSLKTLRFIWPGHGPCRPFSAKELDSGRK